MVKAQSLSFLKRRGHSVLLSLFTAGAVLLSPGWSVQRCAAGTGFPTAPTNETTFSMGVFQIQIDPAFAFLFAPAPAYYYPGYAPGSGILTSPLLIDTNFTEIGLGVSHIRNTNAPTYFPAIVGMPPLLMPPAAIISSYGDYAVIPAAFANAPSGGPGVGVDEVFTEIESFALTCIGQGSTGGLSCPDPRVPSINSSITMVYAGPDEIPNLPQNRRSIGMVQQLTASNPSDFPAQSFFDIFVEVDLPQVPGNASMTDFPAVGAILYNDASSPLVIVNSNVTSLPPTVVYIHGQSTAVPLKFMFNNPPYWAANDIIGYLTLAGHGVFPPGGSNDCAQATVVLDRTLGPLGSSVPPPPTPWLRPTNLLPSPGSAFVSTVNTVTNQTGTNILDDTLTFTLPGIPTIYLRDIVLTNLTNSAQPPPPNGNVIYTCPNVALNFWGSVGGQQFGTNEVDGPLQVVIFNTNIPSSSQVIYNAQLLSMNLSGYGANFSQVAVRIDPYTPSLGQTIVMPDQRGYRIASFFDVFTDISLDGGNTWYPANRPMRVQAGMPPAAPNTIFLSQNAAGTTLTWQGGFTLQSAANLPGPFIDLPGVVSPFTIHTLTNHQIFFRVRD